MPPATAQNRPLYINFAEGNVNLREFRPALVNGVLQWDVLRPVYHLAYWIQRLIERRIRAATWYNNQGDWVLNFHGGPVGPGDVPYSQLTLRSESHKI